MKIIDIDKLLDSLSGFLETKLELIKLDVATEVHKIVARAIIILFIASVISLAVMLISVGLSMWLNSLLESNFLGFMIVSVFYVLLGAIVYMNRNKIYHSVVENIANQNEKSEHDQRRID